MGSLLENCYVRGVIAYLPHYALGIVPVFVAKVVVTMACKEQCSDAAYYVLFLGTILTSMVLFFIMHTVNMRQRSRDLAKQFPSVNETWREPLGQELKHMLNTGDDLFDLVVDHTKIGGKIMRNPPGVEETLREELRVSREKISSGSVRGNDLKKEQEVAAAMEEILHQVDTVPGWVNEKKIAKALDFYSNHMVLVLTGLTVALIESYSFPIDAQVLYISGGLTTTTQTTVRRLLQTTQFVLNVVSKDGPYPGTETHKSVVGVRAIHTVARRRTMKSKYWDMDALESMPISQATQLATLCLFCHCPIELLKVRGCLITPEEEDLCWHLWRYVGYLLGVEERYLPDTYEGGIKLRASFMYTSRQVPDDTSRQLTQNTFKALEATEGLPVNSRAMGAHVYALLGEELAGALGVPKPSVLDWFAWYGLNLVYCSTAVLNREVKFYRHWSNYYLRLIINDVIALGKPGSSLDYIKPGKPPQVA